MILAHGNSGDYMFSTQEIILLVITNNFYIVIDSVLFNIAAQTYIIYS